MATIAPLSRYHEARATLLSEAEAAGARISSVRHPKRGPEGEELATDVARFGAEIGQAERVVLLLSGVHGVEGHAGNGLQRDLVASGRLASLPTGTAVVLVHAVNPYGMAWHRRVDAANIDVNRNFVDPDELPDNPLYDRVDPLLNPTDATLDPDDQSFLAGLMEFSDEVGGHLAMKTLSGGQYSHPRGVQFGGLGPSWSRSTLERIWAEHLAGARLAVNLDVHTGLGPMGRLTVFQTADDEETAAQMGQAWYPEHLYRSPRTEDDKVDHGLLGPGFDDWAARHAGSPTETATFVLEFGTHDIVKGITSFRADNWVHNQGDPTDETGRRVAALMREMFFVDDTGWRAQVHEQGHSAIHTALDAVVAD